MGIVYGEKYAPCKIGSKSDHDLTKQSSLAGAEEADKSQSLDPLDVPQEGGASVIT